MLKFYPVFYPGSPVHLGRDQLNPKVSTMVRWAWPLWVNSFPSTVLRNHMDVMWTPQVGSETRLPPGFSQCSLCLFSMGTQGKSATGWLITLWRAVRRIRILLPKSRWKEDSKSSETNFYLRCPDVVGVTGVNTRQHQGTCEDQLSRFSDNPMSWGKFAREILIVGEMAEALIFVRSLTTNKWCFILLK